MRHGGFAFALKIDGNARKCWLRRFAEIPFIVHANYGHRLRDAKSEFAADAQNVCGRNVVGDEDANWFWHGGKRLRTCRANGDAQSGRADDGREALPAITAPERIVKAWDERIAGVA